MRVSSAEWICRGKAFPVFLEGAVGSSVGSCGGVEVVEVVVGSEGATALSLQRLTAQVRKLRVRSFIFGKGVSFELLFRGEVWRVFVGAFENGCKGSDLKKEEGLAKNCPAAAGGSGRE